MADETAREAAASIATLMGAGIEDNAPLALDLGPILRGNAQTHSATLRAVTDDLAAMARALEIAVRRAEPG
jgi:hypothetical protein